MKFHPHISRKIFLVGILLSVFLLFNIITTIVKADVLDGFDTYSPSAAGTQYQQFMGPWGVSLSSQNCWSGAGSYPPTGVSTLPTPALLGRVAVSPQNVFLFSYTPICSNTGASASLSAYVNPADSGLAITFDIAVAIATATGVTACTTTKNNPLPCNTVTFQVIFDNQYVAYTNDTATMPVSTTGIYWTVQRVQAPVVIAPNNYHLITFKVNVASTSGTIFFIIALDNIEVQHGAFVFPAGVGFTPNLTFVDAISGQWENMSAFFRNTLLINMSNGYSITCDVGANAFYLANGEFLTGRFPNIQTYVPVLTQNGASSCLLSNIGAPTILIPTPYQFALMTFQTPTYRATLIPCVNPLANGSITPSPSCSAVTMYLYPPALTQLFSITVIDATAKYSKARYFIYSGSTLIDSGYLSSAGTIFASLLPNTEYKLVFIGQNNIMFTTSITTPPSASVSITVPIAGTPFTISPTNPTIQYAVIQDCQVQGQIDTAYTDTQSQTTTVTFTLYRLNASGLFPLSKQTLPMSGQTVTTTFTKPSNIPFSQLLVGINATQTTQTITIPPYPVTENTACGGFGELAPIPFPSSVLGLNAILPSPAAWVNLFALFILIMTAALFGARTAVYGTLFVTIELAIFTLVFHWLPITTSLVWIFLTVAFMTYLIQRSRKGKYT
jgi:hypothetical protein